MNVNSIKRGDVYDLIVIGAGPAGMTTALFASRAGLNVGIMEKITPGGQLGNTEKIDNYPGYAEGINGYELASMMENQMNRFGAQLIEEEVIAVDFDVDPKLVKTGFGEYQAKSIVIATGSSPRKLEVDLEDELMGKGVSYCATCDGGFFRDKTVMVVGGGNTAAADAIYLARIATKVYVVHRRDTLRATPVYHRILEETDNIEFLWNSEVTELLAKNEVLGGAMVRDNITGEIQVIHCEGLFVAVGSEPNTAFLTNTSLPLDDQGYIIADETGKTEIPGIYVAGDARTKPLRQVATAIADGANAAEDAAEFLAS